MRISIFLNVTADGGHIERIQRLFTDFLVGFKAFLGLFDVDSSMSFLPLSLIPVYEANLAS